MRFRDPESTEYPGDRNSKLFLHAEDRVLGRLGDAELHHFFGFDLNRFTSRGIPADAGFAIDQDEFAETGEGE